MPTKNVLRLWTVLISTKACGSAHIEGESQVWREGEREGGREEGRT